MTMLTDTALLDAARRGDRAAFDQLARRERDRIRLHCYRMLGSFHDAEDAVQETLVKAWRAIGRFEGRSTFGTWLYRIATNTCLNMLRRRPRVVVPEEFTDRHRPPAADVPWLQPYPDVYLPAPEADQPEVRIEAKEATRLAFVATMQLLAPRQRAVLLLRDVLGWHAGEVAEALDTTVAAVNSALQRARTRLAEHRTWEAATPDVEAVVDRFVAMWESGDVDGIVGLLTDDAFLAMPPTPAWFQGPAEIGEFLRSVPGGGDLRAVPLVRVGANGQPALAAYLAAEGQAASYGVMLFEVAGDRLAGIVGFQDPRLVPLFGLPEALSR